MITYSKYSEFLIDVFLGTNQQQTFIGEICHHQICGWIFFDRHSYERIQNQELVALKQLISRCYEGI
jgi:hypothetical protein